MASVGIVIPTYNAERFLPHNLPLLMKEMAVARVLVIDSSSRDKTIDYARSLGAEVEVIPQSEFNHGATRERARKKIGTDIVVMMTQDAIPSSETVSRLIAPLVSGEASISYARQVPHDGADFFESFPRHFNYPAESNIRSIQDASRYGPYTFFCSDSCAAWLSSALDEIGGFPNVLTGEDGVATALLLRKGHKIAYVADAIVKHSHRYSLAEEFKRYFDTGIERHRFKDLFFIGGLDEKRGAAFFRSMLLRLLKEQPHSIPYAIVNTAMKYLGYKAGQYANFIPQKFWKSFSSQPYFWNTTIGKDLVQKFYQN